MKKSKLEVSLNYIIIYIFCLELVFTLAASIYSATWDINNQAETDSYLHWNIDENHVNKHLALRILQNFGTWLLIFTDFVPISLLVTLEVVKFWQAYFIT